MCVLGALAATGIGGGAATTATLVQTIGAVAGIGGTIMQTMQARADADYQTRALEAQKTSEAQIASVNEQRARKGYQRAFAQQRAQLAARGVALDSPTAVYLGQTAAKEMTFEVQSIRSGSQAKQAQLTGSQQALKAEKANALFSGVSNVAGQVLTAQPKLWPELLS